MRGSRADCSIDCWKVHKTNCLWAEYYIFSTKAFINTVIILLCVFSFSYTIRFSLYVKYIAVHSSNSSFNAQVEKL